MLRLVLHDWADDFCVKILKELRAAAGPMTQLVIIDNLVTYACGNPESVQDIPGGNMGTPPPPLLANNGQGNALAYFSDMQVRTVVFIGVLPMLTNLQRRC